MNIPDLSEIPDLEVQPEGEYNLKIVSAKEVTSANTGREGFAFTVHNLDVDNAVPIFHRIWFPMDSDDEAKTTMMWRMVKEFIVGLGIDPSDQPSPKDFIGIEFSALVKITKDQNGNDQNEIGRITD